MENFNAMRNTLYSLFAICLSCTVLSCSRVDQEPVQPVDSVVLHARFAEPVGTKTHFGLITTTHSYARIDWSAQDMISVFFKDPTSSEYLNAPFKTDNGGSEADFVSVSQEYQVSGNSFVGLYPYDESATVSGGSVIETVVPAEQHAVAGHFDPLAFLSAGVSSSVSSMAFYNVCSGLTFTLESNSYTHIQFFGNNSEKIAGAVTVSLQDPTHPAATAKESVTTIDLYPPEGGFVAGEEYTIAFLPVEFYAGFTMRFYKSATSYVDRSCTASVSFLRNRIGLVYEADQDGKLARIKTGNSLVEGGEAANCYIISEPGSYKFPAVMGNSDIKEPMDGLTEAFVLWESDNTAGSQTVGSIIEDGTVGVNNGWVFFDTPSTLKDGNAVIAVKRGDDIVWSWHIWVCEGYDPVATRQKLYGKEHYMLDRNLGALSAKFSQGGYLCNGLFYQWGRKDPFPGAAQSIVSTSATAEFFNTTAGSFNYEQPSAADATVEYSIKNPFTFMGYSTYHWTAVADDNLWGSSKTKYDPCPAGWKVPDYNTWTDVKYKQANSGSYGYGAYIRLAGMEEDWYITNGAWYPNNGYVGATGALYLLGGYCCYWTVTPYADNAYALLMSSDGSSFNFNPRAWGKVRVEGHSVRCIEDN